MIRTSPKSRLLFGRQTRLRRENFSLVAYDRSGYLKLSFWQSQAVFHQNNDLNNNRARPVLRDSDSSPSPSLKPRSAAPASPSVEVSPYLFARFIRRCVWGGTICVIRSHKLAAPLWLSRENGVRRPAFALPWPSLALHFRGNRHIRVGYMALVVETPAIRKSDSHDREATSHFRKPHLRPELAA
jgi:hypothetical protein